MNKNITIVMSVFLLICPIWAYANALTIHNNSMNYYSVLMWRGDNGGSYTVDLEPYSSIFYNNPESKACRHYYVVPVYPGSPTYIDILYGTGQPSAVIYRDKDHTDELARVSSHVTVTCGPFIFTDGTDISCPTSGASNVTTTSIMTYDPEPASLDCIVTIAP